MKSKQGTEDKPRMKRKDYEKELRKLQVELCHLQTWVKQQGARIIVVFEGRDAAGKGGTIRALTERVSPRDLSYRGASGALRSGKVAALHAALHRAVPCRR